MSRQWYKVTMIVILMSWWRWHFDTWIKQWYWWHDDDDVVMTTLKTGLLAASPSFFFSFLRSLGWTGSQGEPQYIVDECRQEWWWQWCLFSPVSFSSLFSQGAKVSFGPSCLCSGFLKNSLATRCFYSYSDHNCNRDCNIEKPLVLLLSRWYFDKKLRMTTFYRATKMFRVYFDNPCYIYWK